MVDDVRGREPEPDRFTPPAGVASIDKMADALYLVLLHRHIDAEGLRGIEEGRPSFEQAALGIVRSEEYRQLWGGGDNWYDSALKELVVGDGGSGEALSVEARLAILTLLLGASIRRSQATHEFDRDRTWAASNDIARLEREIAEGASGSSNRAAHLADKVQKDQRALAYRLASIEKRLYSSPAIQFGDTRVYGMQASGHNVVDGPFGHFMVLAPDHIGGCIERGEFWDPHLKPIFERAADKTRVAVDAGAFIGFHSVFLSKLFKTVHAFEPQTHLFQMLAGNAALNRSDNLVAHNKGLFDRHTKIQIAPADKQQIDVPWLADSIDYRTIGNAGGLSFAEEYTPAMGSVEAVPLDSLDLQDVGLIKIDTQGADLNVLRGAIATISRSRPIITFEFEERLANNFRTKWDDVDTFFENLNYKITEIAHPAPSQWDYLAEPL